MLPPKEEDIRDVEVRITDYDDEMGHLSVEVTSSYDPGFVAKGKIYIKETTKSNLEKHIIEHSRYIYVYRKMLDKYECEPGRSEIVDNLVGKTLVKVYNTWEK